MTDIQNKLLELLSEVDAICKREGIQYYLCEETAHGAIKNRTFHSDCCQANIAMTTDNVQKFMRAVNKENRADRIVDSMLTNKAYPDFTVRYGDTNTMMIQLPYDPAGIVPCMAVTIHMIRYKPLIRKKYYKYSNAFWKVCRKDPGNYSGIKKLAVMACHVVKRIFGEGNISRALFKKWCRLFASNKKAKTVSIAASKYIFDAEILKYEDTAVLEDKEFPVFGYVDAYLNKAYKCSDFRKMTPKYTKPSSTLLVSPFVPYQKYLETAESMGIDFNAVRKNKKKYDKLKKQVSADNKKIEKYYALVFRTEKRFAMYEHYMPMKKLLRKLYEEQRFEELNELLKPYRSVLWDCYKKGLGLCFDKEIFDMTMHILKREGSYTYVKKLQNMVPENHWEPMTVTDYKGELVEITDISELLPEYADNAEEPEE